AVCARSVGGVALKLPSPLYVALTVWPPTLNAVVASVARPEALMVMLVGVPPSMLNVTVPVRVPAPGDTALTVAVKVTDWPNTDGLNEDASVVVVSALLTVCVAAAEVLAKKLASLL